MHSSATSLSGSRNLIAAIWRTRFASAGISRARRSISSCARSNFQFLWVDALQLLANIYAGRLGHEEVRVILDTENYRIRREETLVRLAYTTADKVRLSHNSILLEPMNPFERRLIHTTLNDIPDVETKSEGEGVFKQVRVLYKGIR